MVKRVIFDVGHPAQVHQFKHIYQKLKALGWVCLFVAKDKDITLNLLSNYNLDYKLLNKTRAGYLNKIIQIPQNDLKFFRIVQKFKPQFILNRFSIHSGHISKICGITNIGFSDTEHASNLHRFAIPFTDIKFTGASYYNDLGGNHFRLDSNIELFYLHPKIFVPSFNSYERLSLSSNERYCVLRFVSWEAHHDVGVKVMLLPEKIKLVQHLQKHFKVLISSEGVLPDELGHLKINIEPQYIHTILKDASLYIGEGGTMASEAVCLNTPVIYTNPLPLMGYLKEQQSYGLLHQITDYAGIISKIESAETYNCNKYNKYIATKINPTDLIVWFLEKYPLSKQVLEKNPDYQYNFL